MGHYITAPPLLISSHATSLFFISHGRNDEYCTVITQDGIVLVALFYLFEIQPMTDLGKKKKNSLKVRKKVVGSQF